MIRRFALTLALALGAGPAAAALTEAQLDRLAARPAEGARFDHGTGRPTVLIFADYDCGALCDAILGQTTAALSETGLDADRYALLVVGLDPRDGAEAAASFRARQAAPLDPAAITTLHPDADRVDEIAAALGYRYAYDAGEDRFAHPAATYVLAASGEVVRVLPALQPGPGDLRLALVEAGEGRIGGLGDRLALLCYGFDPASGRYNLAIYRTLTVLSVITALGVFGAIGTAHWRERRMRP